jgi:septal ring factor EnvC (AmiA/AmiB activator)
MPRGAATRQGRERRPQRLACAVAVLGCGAAVVALLAAPTGAGAASLEAKLEAARGQASALAADLQATQSRLAAAQRQASAAAAREQRLSDMLAHGEERSARLAGRVAVTERRLAAARARLRRARRELARRLVAIYESGSPDTADVVLGGGSYNELVTRAHYLSEIEGSDSALAARVAQVRDEVRRELAAVAALKARVDAYDARLAAARSEIATARAGAEAAASRLREATAARSASLASLRSKISTWVADIQAAPSLASRASAEGTVERWLGGPYSIPTYIVMCESGGNYGAVNPSSGAGGAYQILPSTWALYGGHGAPQEAPKPEQDRIAAEIWADSGPGAWVCG